MKDSIIRINGASLKLETRRNKVSKFELSLNALEKDDALELEFQYCVKLFRKETVARAGMHLIEILKGILRDKKTVISKIEMMTEGERKQMLYQFNDMLNTIILLQLKRECTYLIKLIKIQQHIICP
ncbi:MAG: condensation domain-containing protein [Anaerocolumna sp.]